MSSFRPIRAVGAIALIAGCAAGANAQVLAVSGATVLPSAPASLQADALVASDAFLFQERADYTLAADVSVQISESGAYMPGATIGGAVPAGTEVSVYMFHWDLPAGGGGGRVVGSIQVDPDLVIAGVITSNADLAASDATLGLPGVAYPTGDVSRRMEIEPDLIGVNGADVLTLSADLATLTFDLGLGSRGIDEMRILTAQRVVPAPAGLAALGVGVGVSARRRRR